MPKLGQSMAEFKADPVKSLVLACLMVVIGALAVTDWIPASSSRVYFHSQEWVLAGLCWAAAAFFIFCSVRGRRKPQIRQLRSVIRDIALTW